MELELSSPTTGKGEPESNARAGTSAGLEPLNEQASMEDKSKRAKLIQEEKRAIGGVSSKVYFGYLEASGGICFFLMVILAMGIGEACKAGSNVWLGVWSTNSISGGTVALYMGVYFSLSFVNILLEALISFITANASVEASLSLHRRMLWSVMRAPMSFFDSTPIGRLLSRFAKDIKTMDTDLIVNAQLFVSMGISVSWSMRSFPAKHA